MRRFIFAVGIALTLSACGGGGSSTPTAPSAPPPPTFFNQSVTGSLGAGFGAPHSMFVTRPGNATITLSWPGSADLDVFLTDAGCTDIFQQRTCQRFGTADSVNQNPERITMTVNPSQFNVWVVNASRATSANYTLELDVRFTSNAEVGIVAGDEIVALQRGEPVFVGYGK